jgi:hemerythrin-like metal-binding protein
MPILTWSPSLMVNYKPIDSQHQRLVALINELHDAMTASKGRDVLTKTFDGLIDYTRSHFATEERMMRSRAYPSYISHKKEHDLLTQQVLDLRARYEAGEAVITVTVMRFLKTWISNHILTVDKQLGDYMARATVGEAPPKA